MLDNPASEKAQMNSLSPKLMYEITSITSCKPHTIKILFAWISVYFFASK